MTLSSQLDGLLCAVSSTDGCNTLVELTASSGHYANH